MLPFSRKSAAFLRSKAGSGFITYLVLCALLAAGGGVAFYNFNLRSFEARYPPGEGRLAG